MTKVEHRKLATAPINSWHGTEVRGDVPESRKRAVSEDAALKREAKRAWAPRPLEASLALRPPAPSVAEHAGRSGGHDHSPASLGPAHVRDPNGQMPRQLLWWFRHELAVVAVRGPIGERPGRVIPRPMRGGVGHDPRMILVRYARHQPVGALGLCRFCLGMHSCSLFFS